MASGELTAEDAEAIIDAVAPLLGLLVADADRPGVVLNLQLAARMAAVAATVDLDDHDEAAPVFEA